MWVAKTFPASDRMSRRIKATSESASFGNLIWLFSGIITSGTILAGKTVTPRPPLTAAIIPHGRAPQLATNYFYVPDFLIRFASINSVQHPWGILYFEQEGCKQLERCKV